MGIAMAGENLTNHAENLRNILTGAQMSLDQFSRDFLREQVDAGTTPAKIADLILQLKNLDQALSEVSSRIEDFLDTQQV